MAPIEILRIAPAALGTEKHYATVNDMLRAVPPTFGCCRVEPDTDPDGDWLFLKEERGWVFFTSCEHGGRGWFLADELNLLRPGMCPHQHPLWMEQRTVTQPRDTNIGALSSSEMGRILHGTVYQALEDAEKTAFLRSLLQRIELELEREGK